MGGKRREKISSYQSKEENLIRKLSGQVRRVAGRRQSYPSIPLKKLGKSKWQGKRDKKKEESANTESKTQPEGEGQNIRSLKMLNLSERRKGRSKIPTQGDMKKNNRVVKWDSMKKKREEPTNKHAIDTKRRKASNSNSSKCGSLIAYWASLQFILETKKKDVGFVFLLY